MSASAPTSARSSKPLRLYGVAAYLPQAVRQGSLPARHERGFFRNGSSLTSSLAQWGGGDGRPSVVLAADDVEVPGLVSPEGGLWRCNVCQPCAIAPMAHGTGRPYGILLRKS
ncbi:hypothetical protein [Acetobacter senegalensis]|uniref:hypothetical protein n=1 Tax=Acetobacter senegalensis TaxID=446692 RepID=UPI001EDBE526|nr:hypothetical protein [Acetobacter senegalensis]MCG4257094.1 hypothetical protein [Acetobacter senegalensis]MCG4266769.1 hypothetical protein [Acetobacter senegalensis]